MSKRRWWTQQELAVCADWSLTLPQVGDKLPGRTRAAIEAKRVELRHTAGRATEVRKWTDVEDDIIRAGGSNSEVAATLGRSAIAVQKRRRQLGLAGQSGHWTAAEDELIRSEKHTVEELTGLMDRSREAIRKRHQKLGIPIQRNTATFVERVQWLDDALAAGLPMHRALADADWTPAAALAAFRRNSHPVPTALLNTYTVWKRQRGTTDLIGATA